MKFLYMLICKTDMCVNDVTLELDTGAVVERLTVRLGLDDCAEGRHAARQPNVAANRGSATDGDATEYGRAGIDDHIIFDDRMARLTFDKRTLLIDREAFRAERHRLIDPNALADDYGLSNHDAGAMIDEEAAADLSARMNVDAGLRVREFCDDASHDWRAQRMQHVRDAVVDRCFDAREA